MTTRNNEFTKSIKYPSQVEYIIEFVHFLQMLGIITEEAVEDFDNHLHDELSVCPDCEHFNDECSCREMGNWGREYDDEASFE
jgi:hypothetical protein